MKGLFFRRLHVLVLHEIDTFEKHLQHLLASDYPTGTGFNLIRELLTELTNRKSDIERISNDYSRDPKGAGERLQSEHRKVTLLFNDYTAGLESAQTRGVPWEIAAALERLADVLNPGHQLLISCNEAFNYRILWHPSKTRGLYSFNRLEIPAIHRSDGLLHVLVGHELFHPVLEDFFKREQAGVLGRLRTAVQKILTPGPTGPLFETNRLDQWVEFARAAWLRAMEELMCDMGCVAIFGPAALLSSWSFALGRNLDQPPTYPSLYPPWRYRVRTLVHFGFSVEPGKTALQKLYDLLKQEKESGIIAENFRDYLEEIRNEITPETDIAAIRTHPFLRVAYDEVALSLERGWEYVKTIVTRSPIAWTDQYNEIPDLLQLISNLVPPSEIRKKHEYTGPTPSGSSILIAVWLSALHAEVAGYSDPASGASGYQRYSKLLLKAFADAEIKRGFRTER